MASEETLSATLVLSPEDKTKLNTITALQIAKSWHIDDTETADAVSGERKEIKRALAEVEAWYDKFVSPAKQIVEAAKDLFKPRIEDLKSADAHYKGLLEDWSAREARRVAEENAKREMEARRLRQEADAKAAAERARAAEQAREATRKAQEAEEARRKAEAEGNAKAAAKAAAEAAKQAEMAQAVIESGNAKAAQAQFEAAAAAPVLVEAQAVAGTTMRMNWVAELKPDITEDQAKALIVVAAASRPELLGLIDIKKGSIDKLAKALKGAFNVPGYIAVNRPIAAKTRER